MLWLFRHFSGFEIFLLPNIPLLFLAALLASCNSFTSTPTLSPAHRLETASSPVSTAVAETQIRMSERIVYYYFVTTAENPIPEGSVVIAPEVYILAPAFSDLTGSSDTAADLRAALEAVLQDGRNGWKSSHLEIVAVNFSNGHADVVLQGEYFGVGDVTLIAASMQILMTVFSNASVQSAAVTLNGDTIGNLGVSMSTNAKPAGYVFTRAEIKTFMHEHAYGEP